MLFSSSLLGKDFKKPMNLEILEADLNNPRHAEAILQLVDEYARLPIGQGSPLTAKVSEQLVPGLRRHPGTLVFLAWLDRRAVGIAVCMTGFSTFTAKPLINIHDLAVTVGCRRRGVGRRLLKAVEAKAPQIGLRESDSGGARRERSGAAALPALGVSRRRGWSGDFFSGEDLVRYGRGQEGGTSPWVKNCTLRSAAGINPATALLSCCE